VEHASFLILAVNPGSTSTKAGVFRDEEELAASVIRHRPGELASAGRGLLDQYGARVSAVTAMLDDHGISGADLSAVVGRGGLLRPIPSGTYIVNDAMMRDLEDKKASSHASTLGGIIAREMGEKYGIPAYIVDPVSVDEMEPVARISGIPMIERRSTFHALNAKAAARACAADLGMRYEDGRFVVAHMGGGISVGAHRYGRVIDVNNALYGEGPFSPERCGALPAEDVIRMCYSGQYTEDEMIGFVTGRGGMISYIGVNDMRAAYEMIDGGDARARLVVEAMAYQISKEIGAMASVLGFDVDATVLTGGIAHSRRFTDEIEPRVRGVAPLMIYPGEDELRSLAMGALRVLRGEEAPASY
jgi:butyrate kinase